MPPRRPTRPNPRYRRNADEGLRRAERSGDLVLIARTKLRQGIKPLPDEAEALMRANNVSGFAFVPQGGLSVMPHVQPFPFGWAESPHHLEPMVAIYSGIDLDDDPGFVDRFFLWACNARPGDASEFHSLYLIVAIRGDARDETGQIYGPVSSGDLGAPVYP